VAESRSLPTSLILLWLVGNALRLPILAVPPVIPALRGELHLSGTQIGILTGLPVFLFAIAALAGMLMFSSKALTYYGNIPFRLKMVCLLLAGINMAMFHWLGTRHLETWDRGRPPRSAKLAGGASLLLWVTIVAAGRWVGFTT